MQSPRELKDAVARFLNWNQKRHQTRELAYDVPRALPVEILELHSRLLEASPNGVLALDENDTIVELNPAAELLFGFDRRKIVGQNVRLVLSARSKEASPHIETILKTD